MIKYIFYKALQISVLIYIPFCFAEHVALGEWIMSFITFIIMKVYLDDLHNDSLEKELHGELY
jgi:hypothetical protein